MKTNPPPPPLPEQVVDAAGQTVTDDALLRVFEASSAFDGIAAAMNGLLASVRIAAESPWGRGINLATLTKDVKNAQTALRWAKPYVVCPMGRNCDDKCKACKGTKWLTKGEWNALPPELKAKA